MFSENRKLWKLPSSSTRFSPATSLPPLIALAITSKLTAAPIAQRTTYLFIFKLAESDFEQRLLSKVLAQSIIHIQQ